MIRFVFCFNVITLFLFLGMAVKSQGQQISSRGIISCSGLSSKNSHYSYEAILGQISPIETVIFDGQYLLRQGFLKGKKSKVLSRSVPFVSLYPNPNDGNFFIINLTSDLLKYEIRNSYCQLIIKDNLLLNENSVKTQLTSGIYFFIAIYDNKTHITRFIVR